jgi:NAD-dependent DNA ligase
MTLQKFQALRKELTRHDYRYYVLFQPTISDQLYNKLYREWQDLCGVDTHSLETEGWYPQWVRDEFKGVKPRL